MTRLFALALISLIMLGLVERPAAAQSMDLSGAWSWDSPRQGGLDHNTILLNTDGTYTRVSRAPNGMLLRYEGIYSLSFIGPDQVVLQSQIRNWYPSAMCSQIPSMGIRNCGQVPRPPNGRFQLAIMSATQMQSQGMVMSRDPNPYLLSASVPAQYVQNEAAPRQPVMPTLHPYDQSAVHRGMNDFVYGRLRGCSYKATGQNGTYYSGCDR